MLYVCLLVLCLCSPIANAQAGLFTKTDKKAALHMPWEEKGISWEFMQKAWGMWNIYAVKVDGQYISGTSGTDWEYVYYAKPDDGDQLAWMGGNHGNESLKTIEFLVDGNPVGNGNHKTEQNLVIIETSDLVYPEGNRVVGSVVRKYVIDLDNPNRFDFSQQTTWHSNMLVDRAFVCMLPILKKHGRHLEMGCVKDSFADKTRSDGRKGYQKVTEVLLYGDAGWGMIAGINSLDVVDNYLLTDGGAYIWDLSVPEVKLYYPRIIRQGLVPVSINTIWAGNSYYIVLPVEK